MARATCFSRNGYSVVAGIEGIRAVGDLLPVVGTTIVCVAFVGIRVVREYLGPIGEVIFVTVRFVGRDS